jgi:hypothetical protein
MVTDRLPDRFVARTLRETVINKNGNTRAMVQELSRMIIAKMADPDADKIYELRSLGDGLKEFQNGIEACLKP